MRKPRRLVPGDRMAVVAPASGFDRDRFDRGVAEIARLGLEPVLTDGVFERRGYVAGEARGRAAALTAAWRDPGIAAVIGARGGYGSAQLLPLLDRADLEGAPKAFIGHSDLTALLVYLTIHCGVVCFHGTDRRQPRRRRRGLRPRLVPGQPDDPGADGRAGLRRGPDAHGRGDARGPLLGGTLTQLAASLGTPQAFSPARRLRAAARRRRRAPVPDRPHADPVDRKREVLGRAAAVVCGGTARLRRARRRADRVRRRRRRSARRLSRAGAVRVSHRPYVGTGP